MLGPLVSTSMQRRAPTGGRPPATAEEIDGDHPQRFRAGPIDVLHPAIVFPIASLSNACAIQVHPVATTSAHGLATSRDCERDRWWPSLMLSCGSNERPTHRHRVSSCVFNERLGHASPPRCNNVRQRDSRPSAFAKKIDGGHPKCLFAGPMNVLHTANVSRPAWSLNAWALVAVLVVHPKCPLDQLGPSKELPRKSTHSPAVPQQEERITAKPRGES